MGKLKIKKRAAPLTLDEKIKKVLRNYFATQFVLMVIVALVSWGVLTLLNVKYAIILSVLTGLLSAIPNFGITIAAVITTLVVVFDKINIWPNSSPVLEGLLVLIIFVLFNKFIDLFLAPLFLGKANKVNPVILFVIVLLGTFFFGIWGAILSVPLFLVMKTVVEHFSDS